MHNQLLLFQEPSEKKQEREIETLKEKYESLRKSQHARISMLQKEVKDLKSDLELIKSNICKGNLLL